MLIVISSLIPFLTAIALIVLIIYQPASRYTWLIAIGGAILGLASVFAWQGQLGFVLSMPFWQPTELFTTPIAFRANGLSWPYALSLSAVILAILLTAMARPNFSSSMSWAGTLALGGLGLLAVTADNPITLLLVWGALDLIELIAQLRAVEGPLNSEKVVIAFSSHALGIGFLAWANVVSVSEGRAFDFVSMPAGAGLYLTAAAGLRMSLLSLHVPYSSESSLQGGFGASLRLVSAAASLSLLSHIPAASLTALPTSLFLALTTVVALYGAWMWLRTSDELSGRPYWFITLAALSMASALSGNPAGSVAWGCSLLLMGGALFLTSIQSTWLSRGLLIGVFGLSSLPFSLTASAWQSSPGLFFPLLVAAQALVMAGYIRHALRSSGRESLEAQPVWAATVYPSGIVLLILTQVLLGLFGWDGAHQIGAWLPAILASLLTFGLMWAIPRFGIFNPVRTSRAQSTPTQPIQGYGFLVGIYQFFSQISTTISNVLEGESGLMWTLLFLALFVSLMSQGGF